jgi:YegS/Rv2252/BmrU family lipid kinase
VGCRRDPARRGERGGGRALDPDATLVILNPAAGHGRAAQRWARARAGLGSLGGDLTVWPTTRPGEGADLTRRGLAAGYRRLLAVGGDGTVSDVVEGYLGAPEAERADAAVGTWPIGSGCDVARALGVRSDPGQLARLLRNPAIRRLDVGRVTWAEAAGPPRTRHVVNMAAFGLAGEVAEAVARRGKPFGGTLSYLVEALRVIARARARVVTLVVDGVPEPAAPYLVGIVANTPTIGGGMRVAPAADAADGRLDLVTVAPCPRRMLLALLARVYPGTHVGQPGVTLRRVGRLDLRSATPVPLNLDGDPARAAIAAIEVLPGVLPMLVPA